ncbi:BREX system P-loop protein BrxC [Flavisolibacter sp. BT320]|nr:BREX system P-loop protein BrxC [Flavisolibacter longurius]
MLIRELFELPIERNINPAVVVSATDPDTIKAEIGEYVFTDDLLERAWKFLDALANKKDQKAGIWINGYYGSGKSHFLKFMHYCLDSKFSSVAFEKILKAAKDYDPFEAGHNEQITESKIKALQKRIADLSCSNIMFNVEAVTDDHSGERLTRIFLNMFNQHRGYNGVNIPLALLLEKPLDKAGKLLEFKSRIEKDLQHNWDLEAADLAGYKLESVLEIAKTLLPDLDVKALHNTLINPETYHIGITSKLIPELKDYLQNQGDNYRLIFLVDEISQYIGNNKDVLLNLQTIIEEISVQLKNKIWIAVTAQQTLEEVVSRFDEDPDKPDEFGKILGRFDTRISMESTDASYITRKRVLDKNAAGTKVLNDLYKQKQDFIQHQFKLSHDLYKGYTDADDFILSYPFVPYQFRLIADVFSAFQRMNYVITEVKNNERSVIGITHYTTKQHAGENVGLFIAFDYFYNELFRNNLTHIGRRVIDKPMSLTWVRNDQFAQRVVSTLFMISNLEDSVLMTFPPNIDNLTVLMMTELDENRAALQKRIKAVIERLIEDSIIREENGKYFFYSEDEIQVTNLIKNTKPSLDDRLSLVDELLRPLIKIESKISLDQNDVRIGYVIDDKEFFRNGDVKVNIVLFDQQSVEDKSVNAIANDLYICLNEWFYKDEAFRKDLEWYTKTIVYFKNNSAAATGEREKTLQITRQRNNTLRDKIVLKLTEKFAEVRTISQQQIIDPSSITGTRPQERFNNLLRFHLDRVYRFMKLAAPYARTAADLRTRVANAIQIDMGELPGAEAKVEEVITANGNEWSIEDLVRHFSKIPFGWKDVAVIDMVVILNARKLRDLEYKNTPRYAPKEFVEKAITTSERSSCWVKAVGSLDAALVASATKAYGEIFKKPTSSLSTDGFKLNDQLRESLADITKEYKDLQDKYYHIYPFGEVFKQLADLLQSWTSIGEPQRLFKEITDGEGGAKELRDRAEKIRQFISTSLPKYDEIKGFITANEQNIRYLDAADQAKASDVHAFFLKQEPASEFRVIVKQYDDIKKALQAYVTKLQQEAVQLYEHVFTELEEIAKKEGVPYDTLCRENLLQRLKTTNDITQLQLEKSKADRFKSEQLEKIIRSVPSAGDDGDGGTWEKKTQRYKVSKVKSTIRSQEELSDFLEKLSAEMTKILSQNKTIIIE